MRGSMFSPKLFSARVLIRSGVAAAPLALGLIAVPAMAQDATQTQGSATATQSASNTAADQAMANGAPQQGDTGNDVVVTGSITRNPAAATASPIVSISADDLNKRGLTSVAEAIQTLSSNNQGTAPASWSSFGFATGATAPSLRGLNDAYTLTLFNGLRTAPYPLGDDGYRNFVDINTIPSSMVDRIDVLQDGASATYGSDAIAGVVNVIIKKEVKGLHVNASSGISERGDAGDRYISGTYGYGDLTENHFNVYVNGEYEYTEGLKFADRPGIFSTDNQSSICNAAGSCRSNAIANGLQANGGYNGFSSTTVPVVRPYAYNPATGGPIAAAGNYQLANPAAGCQYLPGYSLTAANIAASPASVQGLIPIYPTTLCQQDFKKQYGYYNSPTQRIGANIRGTIKIGDRAEAYAMFNYYNTTTDNFGEPYGYTGQTGPGGIRQTVNYVFLPVYVCPQGVGTVGTYGSFPGAAVASGCNAANGTLNPANPFAANNQIARLAAVSPYPLEEFTNTKTYRFSAGIDGSFGNGFNYSLAGTTSEVVLDRTDDGYIYLQGLLNALAQGTYNFTNPAANSATANQLVYPTIHNHSVSKLTQIIGSVNKDFFTLPGGALNIAIAGQYRYEAVHNPSENPQNNVNPNARYFDVNGVGVDGTRHVWSASYEVSAPIFNQLRLKAEGSFDHYSTGQQRFSPKFEAEFKPIGDYIKIRGTYSQGFRIPSFAESFSLPTTGFVNASINCASPTYTAFCAAHASNPSYYTNGYSYGLTSAGNINLRPEKSDQFTAGLVIQPTHRIALTVDYYQIKLKDVIIPATASSSLITQYYTNNGVSGAPGVTVTGGVADPQNPTALPLLGNISASYQNADSYFANGIDFSASGSQRIGNNFTFRTKATATMLLRLKQTNADGSVNRYDGSLGACNITSCSGAPRWRAVWLNTIDYKDKASLSLTANYTSGFSEIATDSGGVYGDCATSTDNGQIVSYPDGSPVQCYEKSTFYLDGHVDLKVKDKLTLYLDVKNIFDRKPDYTPNASYGLYNFNPAWQDSLFIGRYFKVGAKVDF